MRNYYEECKEDVINEIVYNLDICDILTLYEIREKIKNTKPLFIRDYIDEFWDNHSEGFRDDLEHELRKFWIKLSGKGYGCYEIEAKGDVDHFTDLYVHKQPLDIWVMEQGTEFNPTDIAHALYEIYIGKVVFKK